MNKKFLFFFLFLGIAGLTAFFILHSSPKTQLHQAYCAFLENHFDETEHLLEKMEQDFSLGEIDLYRGLLLQSKRKFKESNFYFEKALKKPCETAVFSQIISAQVLNAYFEKNDSEIGILIQKIKLASPNHSYLSFFEGLACYFQGNFHDALYHWSFHNLHQRGDDWFYHAFHSLFPASWLQLHIGHCLCELGDFIEGRELLERELHIIHDHNAELFKLGTLFLGYSYLKDAQQKSVLEGSNDYRLAAFYFEKGKVSEEFFREKASIAKQIHLEAQKIFQKRNVDELLQLIGVLENWRRKDALESIVAMIAEWIIQDSDSPIVFNFCTTLKTQVLVPSFSQLLRNQLMLQLMESLKNGESEMLFSLWSSIESLSLAGISDTTLKIVSLTTDEIYRRIQLDSDALSQTLFYLDFWKHLEHSPPKRFQLAQSLVSYGEVLWSKEGEEKKGTRLMDIAISLVSQEEKELLLKGIESFLITLYRNAENANMVKRLTLIYDALAYFEIGSTALASSATLANHLADAEYLFKSHNYSATQIHSEWILKLNPKNENALRLYGLSSFHLGEYKRAVAALKNLPNLDDYSRKALLLSRAFSSQKNERRLAQGENSAIELQSE